MGVARAQRPPWHQDPPTGAQPVGAGQGGALGQVVDGEGLDLCVRVRVILERDPGPDANVVMRSLVRPGRGQQGAWRLAAGGVALVMVTLAQVAGGRGEVTPTRDCGAGEIPNTKKDACESCPSEQITEDGIVCKACTGDQVPNGDQTACEEKGIHKK